MNMPTKDSLLKDAGAGSKASTDNGLGFTIPTATERDFKTSDVSTIDTINNIGSVMSGKMMKGIQQSLIKMTVDNISGTESSYTPIASSTIKLWKDLGIQSQFGSVDDTIATYFSGIDEKTGDKILGGDKSGFGTGIGRSLVINSPFQFNPNDDVRSDAYFPFIGRVFNEKIYNNYPIAIFEVGKIKYNTNILTNTAADTSDTQDPMVAQYIRGDGGLIANTINGSIAVVKTVLLTSWNIATFPITALMGLKKYASFVQQTDIYEHYVNDMMISLASMMGLLLPRNANTDEGNGSTEYFENLKKDPNDPSFKDTDTSQYVQPDNNDSPFDDYAGRIKRLRLKNILPMTRSVVESLQNYQYIPFMIHKDVTVSESISNSTQQNPLQSTLNGIASENEAAKYNNNQTVSKDDNVISATKAQVEGMVKNATAALMRGESGTVISGEGRIALPEIWTDSTFSRSVSMSFKFTSPYGNDLSIFENAYIPFILLFCMAMPRQIGAKTFTTPFIVRVNAKGMFSVPMGIIESMSIERGEDRNSWNTSDRPRTIKCNLSIKDITPTMMMTMNRGVFFPLFAGNDGFTSYLNTLGGLSIKDAGELQNTVKKFWTQMKTRLDSVSHFLTSVGGVGKSIAEGQPINAEDTSVITNFRNFPGVKQFTDFTRWTGIMSGTDNVLSRQGGDHH